MRRLSILVAMLLTTCAASALAGASAASTSAVTLRARAARVSVPAACPRGTAMPGCQITIELRTNARIAHRRSGVLVGQTAMRLAPGYQRRVIVRLTHLGRRLLRRYAPLPLIATTIITVPSAPPVTSTIPTPVPVPPCPPVGPPAMHTAAGSGGSYSVEGSATTSDCAPHVGPTPQVGGAVQAPAL